MEKMLTKEVMTKSVVTIKNDETVLEACNKYKNFDVGCLVVIKDKTAIGIVTERDIIERAIVNQKNPEKTKVEEIMSGNIKTIFDVDSVEKAAETMKTYKIKKLPVIKENQDLVGIITIADIENVLPNFTTMFADKSK